MFSPRRRGAACVQTIWRNPVPLLLEAAYDGAVTAVYNRWLSTNCLFITQWVLASIPVWLHQHSASQSTPFHVNREQSTLLGPRGLASSVFQTSPDTSDLLNRNFLRGWGWGGRGGCESNLLQHPSWFLLSVKFGKHTHKRPRWEGMEGRNRKKKKNPLEHKQQ